MRRFLMMGVVRFVRDGLRRAQSSDDEEAQDQNNGKRLLRRPRHHRPNDQVRRWDGSQTHGPASSLSIGSPCLPDRIRKIFPVYCLDHVAVHTVFCL
jgi:hypothetical protein